MGSDEEADEDLLLYDTFFPGARFTNRAIFKAEIARVAVCTRRTCIFPDNNSSKITARCADVACSYAVRARSRTGGHFQVTSCHVMHSCPPGTAVGTRMVLVLEIVRETLRYDSNAKPGDVVSRARVDYGYDVTYRQAHAALGSVRSGSRSASERSYGLIMPWLKGLQVSNPGSSIDFERDCDGHVKKAYLQLNSWSRSFKFCLPVLSLDAAHLRCKEGGTIFIASALSPNRDIVIVAVGIGLIEDRAYWEWFVRKLNSGQAISSFVDAVVMSDREKGLDSALKDVLPEVPHSYCSFHLKKNVVTTFKTDLGGNIHKLAKALTRHERQQLYDDCKALSSAATEYLQEVGDAKWAASAFPRPRFGMVTTNISESNNSWLLAEREETWFGCLTSVVRKTQQRMFDIRNKYKMISSPYVPWVTARVAKHFQLGCKRLVSAVSDNVYEVQRESNRSFVTVDVSARTCSCKFWQEYQYPCIHACAAIILRREDPVTYVSDYYLSSHLQEVVAPYAQPIDIDYLEPDGSLPPSIEKRRGRPKKVRIRNRSEFINGDSPVRCSVCGTRGHNKRTCARRAKRGKASS